MSVRQKEAARQQAALLWGCVGGLFGSFFERKEAITFGIFAGLLIGFALDPGV